MGRKAEAVCGRLPLAGRLGSPPPSFQRIDVTLGKDRIDAEGVNYSFSAWLGATVQMDSGMSAKAEFFGEGNRLLATSQVLGPR